MNLRKQTQKLITIVLQKIVLYTTLIFCFVVKLSAQNTDSLWQSYNNNRLEDTVRYNSMIKLIKVARTTKSADSVLVLTNLFIKDATTSNNILYVIKGLSLKGSILNNKAEYITAIQLFNKALNLAQKINNKKELINISLSIALSYAQISDYPKASVALYQALKVAEEINDGESTAKAYNNLGLLYSQQKQYTKALYYLKNAIKYAIGESKARIYYSIADIYTEINYLKKAEIYYLFALNLFKNCGSSISVANCYSALTIVYTNSKNYNAALINGKKAMQLYQSLSYPEGSINSFNDLASLYNSLKQFNTALVYGLKADSLLMEYYILNAACQNALELATSYEGLKKFEIANRYLKKHLQLTDSLFKTKNTKQLNNIETQYAVDKKETELIQAAQKLRSKYILWSTALFAFIILFGIVIYYNSKQRKLKHQRNEALLEQKLLRTQMNPHFVFNSLMALKGAYITDINIANNYLTDMAKLIRAILESSRLEYIPIAKEVEMLKQYLTINKGLLNKPLNYQITLHSDLDMEFLLIPPMLIQPFVENAIKYASQNSNQKTHIEIIFSPDTENTINLEVIDNGTKFGKNENNHFSLASTITKERLATLLQQPIHTVIITLEQLKNNKNEVIGVKTQFKIPIKYQ